MTVSLISSIKWTRFPLIPITNVKILDRKVASECSDENRPFLKKWPSIYVALACKICSLSDHFLKAHQKSVD